MTATPKRAPACALGFAVALRRALCALVATASFSVCAQSTQELMLSELRDISATDEDILSTLDDFQGDFNTLFYSRRPPANSWFQEILDRQREVLRGVGGAESNDETPHYLADTVETAFSGAGANTQAVVSVQSEQAALLNQYSNVLENASNAIGHVERPDIPELDVNDTSFPSLNFSGPNDSFSTDFTIIKASSMSAISQLLGVASPGAFTVDFGTMPGVSDFVININGVMVVVWGFVRVLGTIGILIYWWIRIRGFIYAILHSGDPEEPKGDSAYRWII